MFQIHVHEIIYSNIICLTLFHPLVSPTPWSLDVIRAFLIPWYNRYSLQNQLSECTLPVFC